MTVDDIRHRHEFTGDELGVRRAREWLAEHLSEHPLRHDIALVATELCANAIRHTASAGRTFALVLERDGDGATTRLTAEDLGSSDTKPERQEPADGDIHGHGLLLVNETADAWGSDGDRNGREVWAVWDAPAF